MHNKRSMKKPDLVSSFFNNTTALRTPRQNSQLELNLHTVVAICYKKKRKKRQKMNTSSNLEWSASEWKSRKIQESIIWPLNGTWRHSYCDRSHQLKGQAPKMLLETLQLREHQNRMNTKSCLIWEIKKYALNLTNLSWKIENSNVAIKSKIWWIVWRWLMTIFANVCKPDSMC